MLMRVTKIWDVRKQTEHFLSLSQNDFNKVLAKREAESRLLSTIKLPLQKSISTPSILGPRDLQGGEVSVADSSALQTLPV